MSETNILPAPVITLPEPDDKWQREYRAFLRLLPQLLTSLPGKFVAVHEGRVVDSGEDKIALAQRVYQRFGYVPIYIGAVTEQPPIVRIPSRRPLPGSEVR